nr:unknown Function [uncultured bacterium]
MKKTFLYIIVGFFTFLIGLGIVSSLLFRPSYDVATSNDVCQKCLAISETENVETVAPSALVNDKGLYGKKVRVRARLSHDTNYLYFGSDSVKRDRGIPVGFDKNAISCPETEKTFRVCTGYKNWYDGSVELTVVGYLGKIDEQTDRLQGGNEGFNIICIERVHATGEELERSKKAYETDYFMDILLRR